MNRRLRLALCLLPLLTGGCTYTSAGNLAPPAVPPGTLYRPRIEYTVGDFRFSRSGGDSVRSTLDGQLLGGEVFDSWNQRGYSVAAQFVEDSDFSGGAEYQMTLGGEQKNSASFFNELMNVLTLFIVPYTVRQEYELTFVLEDRKCGKTYQATVQGADMTYLGILVMFGFPFAQRGHDATIQQMADGLYEQFWRQGAFEYPCRTAS